eukprot:2140056-Prymnesium_polylepis.1
MSHTISNGGTYYQILNQLSADAAIISMNPTRKHDIRDKVTEHMGKAHWDHLNGCSNTLNALGKIFFGKNPTAHCFLVDDAKLSTAKAEAKAKPGAPEKISANDVLTSAFGRVCRPRLLIMACDFKGRIEGTVAEDAGQYHGGLIFDEQGYAEPAAIRQALTGPPPCSRAALPGCREGMRCPTGLITSWAAFKDLAIPACTLALHTPCEQTSGMVVKSQNATCIVFNPRPGKVAMLCICKDVSSDELMAGLPFEGPLAPKMWPTS